MFGYSAMGSCSMATTPSKTIRIESAMAKMGRSTKNRDTGDLGAAYFGGVLAAGPPGGVGAAGGRAAGGASAGAGFGATVSPVLIFSSPSTMIRSPGLSPLSITQRVPTRSPTCTVWTWTTSSAPTTPTW